ncbi:MAG: asparagine synthase C-terminal domain-containing protein, partial [Gammaproteobacteria bacterium]|nr:asparagine synthase C-terminal domain-containing protein [Gammaproteobacteria bacterium]
DALGTDHREVMLSEAYFAEHLDDALECIDQPTFDALNTYFVSRAVKEAGLTVALAGTGGDELCAGYPSFREIPRARRVAGVAGWLPDRMLRLAGRAAARVTMGQAGETPPQSRWGKFADVMGSQGDLVALYQSAYGLFSRDFLDTLLLRPADAVQWGMPPAYRQTLMESAAGEDELTAISRLEAASFLGERLLRDTDAASMAVSLEVRVPLLDHVFVEALAGVPEAQRFHPLGKKMLLRQIVADQLDPAMFDRDKAGFELPLEVWCKRLLSDRLRDTFQDLNLAHAAGLNAETVGRLWRAFERGGAGIYWSRVWSIYVLLNWCRRHGVYL